MSEDTKREVIIAANRYLEGGRQQDDLKKLADLIASAKDEKDLEERLRLARGRQPPQKAKDG